MFTEAMITLNGRWGELPIYGEHGDLHVWPQGSPVLICKIV